MERLIEKPCGRLISQTVINPKHQGDLDFLWKQRGAGSGLPARSRFGKGRPGM